MNLEPYLRAAAHSTSTREPPVLRRRLGHFAALLRDATALPPAATLLCWRNADGTTESVTLERALIIGRDGACDLRFPHGRLSQRHYRVWAEEGAHWLEDLGSTNGTRLNGVRISGQKRLCPGDLIEAGGTAVFFSTSG